MKFKILVLSQVYPSEGDIYKMMFVHTRLKRFIKKNVDLDVLNFVAKNNYQYDEINVITEDQAKDNLYKSQYNIVISHAPNLRNHLRFIIKDIKKIPKLIFVFHGHEIMLKFKHYPPVFKKLRDHLYPLKKIINILYDHFKLYIMKLFFNKYLGRNLKIVFVSDWFYKQTVLDAKINISEDNVGIIHNPIAEVFLEQRYKYLNLDNDKKDFITIRPLDDSKRCLDLIVKIAESNPNHSFHIYGKGRYFNYYNKPDNIIVFDKFVLHQDIPDLLNQYKAAFMPSRTDSQGVMVCEMATFGIPTIVSDIPVAKEIMKDFDNVYYIDNNNPIFDADKFFDEIKNKPMNSEKVTTYSFENTVDKELEFILEHANS